MICRRCGRFAIETGRDILGMPEVELVIQTMVGEKKEKLPGGITMIESEFRDTQYRPNEDEKYINAVISTIAHHSKGLRTGRYIDRDEGIIQLWSQHRESDKFKAGALGELGFIRNITEALETLVRRGVVKERNTNDIIEYKLSVEFFRRWWSARYPDIDSELDKLIYR